MTPENMPAPPAPKTPRSALRPPEFLLPQTDKSAARKRKGEPDVYVSWGGQIYGPTAVEDVINGVRTFYFEEDALFWLEGRDEWRPVSELPALFQESFAELPTAARLHPAPSEGITPAWPGARKRPSSTAGERRRRSRRSRPGKKSRTQIGGRLIVIAAVLLAVVFTAALLLLLSLT